MSGTGSLRSHPSPAASTSVEPKKLTKGEKISIARKRYWAAMSPERKAEIAEKATLARKRNAQLRLMRMKLLPSGNVIGSGVDEDFDDMGF